MDKLELNAKTTALVLIDLQRGIVSRQVAPYTSAEVIERSARLAEAVRSKGGTVVYVYVNMADFLQLPVDQPSRQPGAPPPPPQASELVPEAGFRPGDLLITKRHWGAFAGTDLEAKLRERGVETVVLAGIATNLGVESTARQGTGLGFAFVIVEDACSTFSAEMQRFAFETIFPRLARVRTTDQVIAALR